MRPRAAVHPGAARLGLAVALALLALAPTLARPATVSACSLAGFQVQRALEEYPAWADAIVVAEVVEESLRPGSQEPKVADHWDARMRILVTLKGDTPAEITLYRLGRLGASCEGGPRLQSGERVLLFLDAQPIGVDVDWGIVAGGQGVIRAERDDATFDRSHVGDVIPAGPLEAVLQDIASRIEASPSDVEAARAALLEEPVVTEPRGEERARVGPTRVALALATGVAALALVLVIMRRGRPRSE